MLARALFLQPVIPMRPYEWFFKLGAPYIGSGFEFLKKQGEP
jgi:hypothetical protein